MMDTSSSSSSGDDDEMNAAEARACSEQIAPPALQPEQPEQQQLLPPQERIATLNSSDSMCSSEDELEDVPSLDASLLQQHYGFSGARQVLRETVPCPVGCPVTPPMQRRWCRSFTFCHWATVRPISGQH
jgi:hypothetical protein